MKIPSSLSHYPNVQQLPRSSCPAYEILTGIGSFSSTNKNPRCNKASKQFINSITKKGGILLQSGTVHVYTKFDTPIPSSIFSFDGNRSGYGNLADIYQQISSEIYASITKEIPQGLSFRDISQEKQASIVDKVNNKVNIYIQKITLHNGFVVVLLNDSAPSFKEGVAYKLYAEADLLRPNQHFPTRIRKQEHLDNMFSVANKYLSF